MNVTSGRSNSSTPSSKKLQALDKVLQESLLNFKDVAFEFETLQNESENYKTQFEMQKKRCESESCPSAEALKKVIDSKNNILELVASALMRLHETRNFEILTETFKLLFKNEPSSSYPETQKLSPTKQSPELKDFNETAKEDSFNEIEGTPTGRTSPIILSKKTKSMIKLADQKNKKKCSEDWPTPEKKTLKLLYTTPTKKKSTTSSGRLRQSRLNIVSVKQEHIVDLTSSPELCGGLRTIKNENCTQPLIKREPSENEDTIQPSPTCEITMFAFNKIKTESPLKFKRPKCLSLTKKENIENFNMKMDTEMEMSPNILNPKRFPKEYQRTLQSEADRSDDDATYCETALSPTLLNDHLGEPTRSPSKPLGENKNITNTPTKMDLGMSTKRKDMENIKRKLPEQAVEPFYKEPTVRKKSEKMALPGWVCDECRNFFGVIYRDDPTKLAEAIERCSKHRGKNNPARPKTPPNYWNPRWNVPDNTEELNRMNNAL